ncbi:MAG: hypothetical protein FJ118_17085 [Deltaproteobacteria bacterium]|nr:hypothetical protein [Deltaproteobacteria bacterium]
MKTKRTNAFNSRCLWRALLLVFIGLLALRATPCSAAGPMPPTLIGVSYGEMAEWQAHYGMRGHYGYAGYAVPFPPYDPSCLVPPPVSVVRSGAGRSAQGRKPGRGK